MAKRTKAAQGSTQSGPQPGTARSLAAHNQPPAPVEPVAPAPQGPRPIKVRATGMLYYDHARRRPGDVFFIAKRADFSERFMEYVDPSTPERLTGAGAALQKAHDEILAGRTPGAQLDDEPHI